MSSQSPDEVSRPPSTTSNQEPDTDTVEMKKFLSSRSRSPQPPPPPPSSSSTKPPPQPPQPVQPGRPSQSHPPNQPQPRLQAPGQSSQPAPLGRSPQPAQPGRPSQPPPPSQSQSRLRDPGQSPQAPPPGRSPQAVQPGHPFRPLPPGQPQPHLHSRGQSPRLPAPTPEERKDLAEKRARDILEPLRKSTNPHIAFSDLLSNKNYRVSAIRTLDFFTGQIVGNPLPSNISHQFLVPTAQKQVLNWLEETKAREVRNDLHQRPTLGRPREEADELWRLIFVHLTDMGKDPKVLGFLFYRTRWGAIQMRGGPYVQRFGDGNQEWKTKIALRFHLEPPGMKDDPPRDPEAPHVIGALVDSAPLWDTHITTGEMTALVQLSIAASRFTMYEKHVLFPATLLAISGRQLRFTQCIYDVRTSEFEIRKTPIISFDKGVWNDKENRYPTVLGWMCGTPTGNTK